MREMMRRREFLAGAAAAAPTRGALSGRWRAAIIGHTGRGNYGHNWDGTFTGMPEVEVVAMADPDEPGRKKAVQRSGARKGYADYREMLRAERPNLVVIAPRHTDQRVEMVTAASEAGAHILLEKPFAGTLAEARAVFAAAAKRGVKIQVGHTHRVTAVTKIALRMIREGAIGTVLEIRARGKEDRRAGGEDLLVLGTHCFDLMRWYAGDPLSCFAFVAGEAPKPAEVIGPVAGREVAAVFEFANSLAGYFATKPSEMVSGERFGVTFYGSKGAIFLPLGGTPNEDGWLVQAPDWKGSWTKIEAPASQRIVSREQLNAAMALDLMQAVEQNREPVCSALDGRWTIEMVAAVHASHRAGRPVKFPLAEAM